MRKLPENGIPMAVKLIFDTISLTFRPLWYILYLVNIVVSSDSHLVDKVSKNDWIRSKTMVFL